MTDDPIDLQTTAGKIADLQRRRREKETGQTDAIERQHAKGKQTAMERLTAFLDEGSFQQLGGLRRHRAYGFGMEKTRPLGDGVMTGYGTVNGRQVYVYAQDFTVFGGSLGQVFGEKIDRKSTRLNSSHT